MCEFMYNKRWKTRPSKIRTEKNHKQTKWMKYQNKLEQRKVAVKGKTTKNGRGNLQVIPQKGKGQKGQKQNPIIGVQNHTPLLHW